MLRLLVLILMLFTTAMAAVEPRSPRTESWDYVPTVTEISRRFTGTIGKVVPMGDSITYANQAGQWVRNGQGRTPEQRALAAWMHAGVNDASNGWWLAANDQAAGRSWTAASGITSGDYLKGGFRGLPSLAGILTQHRPQIALILLGTNDFKRGTTVPDFLKNMAAITQACQEAGTVPVLCSILPTTWTSTEILAQANDGLYALAERQRLPFLDLHGEFLRVRPGTTWQGTLISPDGAHPTHESSAGPATEANLARSGQLLKCYLQCAKVGEIKERMRW